jgi:hypothetical protein
MVTYQRPAKVPIICSTIVRYHPPRQHVRTTNTVNVFFYFSKDRIRPLRPARDGTWLVWACWPMSERELLRATPDPRIRRNLLGQSEIHESHKSLGGCTAGANLGRSATEQVRRAQARLSAPPCTAVVNHFRRASDRLGATAAGPPMSGRPSNRA